MQAFWPQHDDLGSLQQGVHNCGKFPDLGTGKEQSITITANNKLSDEQLDANTAIVKPRREPQDRRQGQKAWAKGPDIRRSENNPRKADIRNPLRYLLMNADKHFPSPAV